MFNIFKKNKCNRFKKKKTNFKKIYLKMNLKTSFYSSVRRRS